MPQLKMLYLCFTENPNTQISYCTPQHQGNSSLCGAFVAAFTVALLTKQTPLQRTQFHCTKMKGHLLDSLQQEHFQFFPSIQNDIQNFVSYLQSQASLQAKHTEQQKLNKINVSNRKREHRLMLKISLTPEQSTH